MTKNNAAVHDVLIAGAGPAGAACAIWLKQAGFSPVLVDAQDTCGGLHVNSPYINSWVPTSPAMTGAEMAAVIHANVLAHGVDFRARTRALHASRGAGHFAVTLESAGVIAAKYIVLAGGVEPKSGGFTAGNGIYIGATPALSQADVRGKTVAVLGGGDNAFEHYGFFKQWGASAVHVFARTVRAGKKMVSAVPASDVSIGEFSVNAATRTVSGRTFDMIAVMYGYQPAAGALMGLDPARGAGGYIKTDGSCATSLPGVFAIGEIANRMHPSTVTSMADGIVAAKALQKLLEEARG